VFAIESTNHCNCSHLWESLVITWDGHVVPCCYDYDAKETLGDITRQSLWEIWNGEAYRGLRRKGLDGCNDSPLCSGCTQAPGRPQQPLWPIVR
jgi:radical SAM protein with 4Fe4S-binding SPASM domain